MTAALSFSGARLTGATIAVGGFKHAFVSVVATALATGGALELANVPDIAETHVMAALLRALGCDVHHLEGQFSLAPVKPTQAAVPGALSRQIHGSVYLIPALLVARGAVRFAEAGGCQIGAAEMQGQRPIAHMLDVLSRFGAAFETPAPGGGLAGRLEGGHPATIDIASYSTSPDVVTGPEISGATKTALIAAAGLARQGESVILHPYGKPDVTDPLRYLRQAGFAVSEQGSTLRIAAHPGAPEPVRMALVDDLSEVVTWICLAKICGLVIRINLLDKDGLCRGLAPELALFDAMGLTLDWGSDYVETPLQTGLRAVDIEVTSQSIYSDHQPFFALLALCLGDGPCRISEAVWTTRFGYASELRKMGAKIEIGAGAIVVHPSRLHAPKAALVAKDLRSAAVLLVAGLSCRTGFGLIGTHHLKRGYSDIATRLSAFGVSGDVGALAGGGLAG